MKQVLLTILTGMIAVSAIAQDKDMSFEKADKKTHAERTGPCPKIYVATSTGINNNTSMAGFSFELPVAEHITIEGGPGMGTWGYKLYAGAKYY